MVKSRRLLLLLLAAGAAAATGVGSWLSQQSTQLFARLPRLSPAPPRPRATAHEDMVEQLQQEIAQLRVEIDSLKHRLLRSKVDYVTLKKQRQAAAAKHQDELQQLRTAHQQDLAQMQLKEAQLWEVKRLELLQDMRAQFEREKLQLQRELETAFQLEKAEMLQQLQMTRQTSTQYLKDIDELKAELSRQQQRSQEREQLASRAAAAATATATATAATAPDASAKRQVSATRSRRGTRLKKSEADEENSLLPPQEVPVMSSTSSPRRAVRANIAPRSPSNL